MSISDKEQLLNTCPECSGIIDVTDLRPYEKTICPLCEQTIRVRTAFNHFTIQSEIGEGGMSRVFQAYDNTLGRQVALKILHAHFGDHPELTVQFEHEARVTASINHPNVRPGLFRGPRSGLLLYCHGVAGRSEPRSASL